MLDALAAPPDPDLRARLGPELHDHLRDLLAERARAWAAGAAPGRAHTAAHLAEVGALLDGHDGPVLLAAPDVPALSAFHTRAAADDMAAGVAFSSAPALDGRPFLIAIGSADPALLDLVREPFESVVAAVVEQDGELGMLRPERRLATVADARALLADPMTPPEITAILHHLRD